MNAAPAFPFYPRDFKASTDHWTLEEQGAYLALLMLQWEVGYIPSEPKRLAALFGVSKQRARSLWEFVSPKFPADPRDGLRRNVRLELIRQQQQLRRGELSERGKKGAGVRYGYSHSNGHGDSDSYGHGGRHAFLFQSEGSESSPPSVGIGKDLDITSTSAREFASFWQTYPRKVGKREALKAWQQTAKERPPIAVVLAALARLACSEQWTIDDGRFVPHPSTWLRRGGWDDEVLPRRMRRDVEALGPDFSRSQRSSGSLVRDIRDLLARSLSGESLSNDEAENLAGGLAAFDKPATTEGLAWFNSRLEDER